MAFPLSTYHSWKGRGEVLEKDLGFHQKFKGIDCGVGAAASSIRLGVSKS
jgi:hypothetical protein